MLKLSETVVIVALGSQAFAFLACNSPESQNSNGSNSVELSRPNKGEAEPIRYPDFPATSKKGKKFTVGISGDLQHPGGRIITFSPPQPLNEIDITEIAEGAMSRSKDGRQEPVRNFADLDANRIVCWAAKSEKREMCAIPNLPLGDGTTSVVRIWWK